MAVGEKSRLLSDALIRESLLLDETGGKSRHSSVLVGDARSASVCFGYTQVSPFDRDHLSRRASTNVTELPGDERQTPRLSITRMSDTEDGDGEIVTVTEKGRRRSRSVSTRSTASPRPGG